MPLLSTSKIILAPMEGVIDAPMRARLTSIGGYDRCVTEFIRVTNVCLPEKVFTRLCPELESGGHTPSGVPVHVQLLGSRPDVLAQNAVVAASLGAPGIDLNFGCPAKTVNNSEGGSILLQRPHRVAEIVAAVRDAVPDFIPVTAKIRLGYEHSNDLALIVKLIREAGADELAIHARTKSDGYRPPAHWPQVGQVVADQAHRTIINGEIWTVAQAFDAIRESGCQHLMLGRGALAAPDLARRIRQSSANDENDTPLPWHRLLEEVQSQFLGSDCHSPRHVGNRTKQWLAYLKRTYPQAETLFGRLRKLHDVSQIIQAFEAHRQALPVG